MSAEFQSIPIKFVLNSEPDGEASQLDEILQDEQDIAVSHMEVIVDFREEATLRPLILSPEDDKPKTVSIFPAQTEELLALYPGKSFAEAFVQAYEDGYSVSELCLLLGRKPTDKRWILSRLEKLGANIRTPGEGISIARRKDPEAFFSEDVDQKLLRVGRENEGVKDILERLLETHSLKAIRKLTGVSIETLRNRAEVWGLRSSSNNANKTSHDALASD